MHLFRPAWTVSYPVMQPCVKPPAQVTAVVPVRNNNQGLIRRAKFTIEIDVINRAVRQRERPDQAGMGAHLEGDRAMLQAHPDLKLAVKGHTDNVGTPADNLKLSEARAKTVMAALVKEQGIDAGRLQAKGLGSTKPAAVNTTAEGRQNNRRVELVKV